jgi:CRP/FNR family cyclic AMP-dependent transcriptional regulator
MGSHVLFLKESDLFYNLTDNQLELVESLCQEHSFSMGETIIQENSRDRELYLIINGSVDIIINRSLVTSHPDATTTPDVIATLRRGQCFGEVALVDEGIRSASAVAMENDTRALVIPRKKFLLLCNTYPEVGYRVMHNLAAELALKIRGADLKIREVLLYAQNPK